METEHGLNKDSLYMNPMTGSVDTGENWEKDFSERDEMEDGYQTWEEWGGDTLIEVVPCLENGFIEVE